MRYSMRDGEVHWDEDPKSSSRVRPEVKSAVDGLHGEISDMRRKISGFFDSAKGNQENPGKDAA